VRNPYIISLNDLISEQEKQVAHFKSLLNYKRTQGENLDGIHRKINLADRTRLLLLRYKKNPQIDLELVNAELNHR
jgi:hypothetical protein